MRNSLFSRMTRRGPLIVGATLLALADCEQVEVTTVSAARVELQPQTTSVAVSESARLTAVVLSTEGKTLMGRTIDWTSLQPTIASVDSTGMVRGMSTGQATIRAVSGDASGTAAITVTAAPSISLSVSEINFSAVQNGPAPGDRTVTVTNGGTGTLSGLTATVRYAAGQPTAWLTASLATTGAPSPLIVSANQRNLTPGTYTATIDIGSSGQGVGARSLTVRLTVVPPSPAIGLGANTISFSATQGASNPAQQQVGVTNAGGGSLTDLAVTINYQSGQTTGWLTASLSGTSAPAQLTLSAATDSLPAGNYTANVRVTSALAQNSPQTVTVTFVVTAVQNVLALSQSTINYFATTGGGNPVSQTVQVTSLTSVQLTGLSFNIMYTIGQPTGWASAVLSAVTSPANLTVNATTGSLPAGTYSAALVVSSPDASNSPLTIGLNFNVIDPLNAPTSLTAAAVSSAEIDLTWTASAGTVGRYRIERKTGPSGTYAVIDSTTATTYQSMGLSPATEYYYRVSACSGVSCSPPSAEANATTLPSLSSAPSGLTATSVSATQVNLSWTAPSSGAFTDYRVERQDPGGSFLEIAQVPGSTTTFSSTGLAGGTQYTYRVRACNQGSCSGYSNTAPALTSPDVPANLAATAVSSSQIDLRWSASTGAASYTIDRQISGGAFAQLATVTGTTYSDTGVTSGTQYSYQVKACNASGCSPSSAPVSPPPAPGPPGTPANLRAQPISPTQIDLTWSAASGTVSTYEIERSGSNGSFAQISTVPVGTVNYSDLTVLADSQYGYRVRACSGATCSSYSNTASAKTPKLPKPGAPGALAATAVSSSQINLVWSSGSGSVAWQIIERSSPGVPFTQIDSVAGNAASYANRSLADSTTYSYRVTACNSAGCSGHSNTATATTPLAVPGVPQNLVAASAGPGTNQINLAWSAATGRLLRYEIEAHRLLQPFAPLATVSPSVLVYQHRGLQTLSIWTYRVRACNSAGCSGYSNESTAFAQ